jgi:hypothetical protein
MLQLMKDLFVVVQQAASVAPYILSGFSALIAVLALLISQRQSRISAEKLRLDLYNRRFDIYSRFLDFYHALEGWKASEAQQSMRKGFIKAYRESLFLFDRSSGVYDLLAEMKTHSDNIVFLHEHGKDQYPGQFLKMEAEAGAARAWLLSNRSLEELEKRMAEYLNFHKISA